MAQRNAYQTRCVPPDHLGRSLRSPLNPKRVAERGRASGSPRPAWPPRPSHAQPPKKTANDGAGTKPTPPSNTRPITSYKPKDKTKNDQQLKKKQSQTYRRHPDKLPRPNAREPSTRSSTTPSSSPGCSSITRRSSRASPPLTRHQVGQVSAGVSPPPSQTCRLI